MTAVADQRVALSDADSRAMAALAEAFPETADADHRSDVVVQLSTMLFRRAIASFGPLVSHVRRLIQEPPYFAVVESLPVERPVPAFLALVASVARPVDPYGADWSRMVHRLRVGRLNYQPGYGVLDERLHTDGTNWDIPNDLTCLLCLQPDTGGGGLTQLLDRDSLIEEIRDAPTELEEILRSRPAPWKLAKEFGDHILYAPILGDNRLRWMKYTIDQGIEATRTIDSPLGSVVNSFQALLDETSRSVAFPLASGSLLVVNNKHCLHARTAVKDAQNSCREMLRIKARFIDPA